jgi:hypothetical protein
MRDLTAPHAVSKASGIAAASSKDKGDGSGNPLAAGTTMVSAYVARRPAQDSEPRR